MEIDNEISLGKEVKSCSKFDVLGVRHIQACLLAGALFVNHIQQGNNGISTKAMSDEANKFETYQWKQDPVEMSKGAFFYALIVSSFLAGYLTTKVDGKLMLLGSTIVGTFVTYITPTLTRSYNWDIFFFIRLIQGSSQGFIRPLVYSQLVRWLPPNELMILGPVVLSSFFLGNGMILMMGGYLSTGQGGWPSIFYFSGNIGFIWCLAYIGLGSSSPNTCFYISANERKYIEDSLPSAIRISYKSYIPWKGILTCAPMYALVISQSANNYAIQSFIKIIPQFYENSLHLDVRQDPSGPQSLFQAKEAVYFFIAIFYLWSGILWELLSSTKVQPFNDIKEDEDPDEKNFIESEIIKI